MLLPPLRAVRFCRELCGGRVVSESARQRQHGVEQPAPAANVVTTLTAVTAKLVSGELSKEDFKEAAVGVSKDAAKAAFELFLPGATAITGLTEDIITKVKEGADC